MTGTPAPDLRAQLRQLAGAGEFDRWLELYAEPSADGEAEALTVLMFTAGLNLFDAAADILEGLVDTTGEAVTKFRAEGEISVEFDLGALPGKIARLRRRAAAHGRAASGTGGGPRVPVAGILTAKPTPPAFGTPTTSPEVRDRRCE